LMSTLRTKILDLQKKNNNNLFSFIKTLRLEMLTLTKLGYKYNHNYDYVFVTQFSQCNNYCVNFLQVFENYKLKKMTGNHLLVT